MFRNLVLALLFGFAINSSALADSASKKIKVKRYLEVVGLQEMFTSQVASQKEQSERLASQITETVIPGESRLTPAQKEKVRAATVSFLAVCRNTFTPERLATVYGDLYGAHFTEAELDEVIAHYESAIGRKEVAASKLTLTEYTNYFRKESEEALKKATTAYSIELKKIVGNPCCDQRQ